MREKIRKMDEIRYSIREAESQIATILDKLEDELGMDIEKVIYTLNPELKSLVKINMRILSGRGCY